MTDPDSMTPLDHDFIDRIVDGGLTPAELRAAIDRLDREPDGWKRCASAFLEAQCWRESFRALEQPAGARRELAIPSVPQATERARRRSPDWRRVAIAAGIAAVSFTMGSLVHPARPPSPVQDATPPAPHVIATHQDDSIPPNESRKVVEAAEPLGEFLRPPDKDRFQPDSRQGIVAVARVRVGFDREGAEVPILGGPTINEQWLRDQPPRLSEHQQALLERCGYQVDQHRRIITATLADGRRVTLPVDQVQVRFTGNNPL
jgi:hypothetical protein